MTDRIIVEIPIDQIHESPFNPRKRFTGIAEMAETMKPPNGRVQSALLVRPRVPPLFAGDADAMTGYELVFGHRRRRAGVLAGLATMPCEVRAMTDAEARHCQIVENLAREDVHPFEEAEGFAQLISQDGLTADEVAEQFKRSRSYVYGRLKLLQACPEVRDACLDDAFGSEVALLISRVGNGNWKLQQKALAGVRSRLGNSHLLDGGKDSFRRVRDYLVEHFSLKLKEAIFDTKDATLLPDAGTCGECPKRSGNAPEYEDVATAKPAHHYSTLPCGPDICTDPECFAAKKAAHLARKAQELSAAGAVVINGAKARQLIGADGKVKGGYVALKDVQAQLKAAGKGAAAPEVVTVINQRTGQAVKAVKVDNLPASAKPKPESSGRQQRDRETERREREVAMAAESTRRGTLHPEIRTRMLAAQGSAVELRLIAWLLSQQLDWQVEQRALARHGITPENGYADRADFGWLDAFSADQLRVLLMDLVLDQAIELEYEETSNRPLFELVASVYGVDTGDGSPAAAATDSTGQESAPAEAQA
jgi:ParB/RepB/Spo0J family partition protein